MPFGEHLDELRRRLGFALLGLVPILIGALVVGKQVIGFLMHPVENALIENGQSGRLQVTGPLESFNSYFYVALVLTVMAGAPWLLFQLWMFIAPGLYARERRFAYILTPLSLVLTVLSALFTYYIMVPVILDFFVKWNASFPVQRVATAPLPEGTTLPAFPLLAGDPPSPQPGQIWINTRINELRICVAAAGGAANGPLIRGTTLVTDTLLRQEFKVSQTIDMLFNFALAFAAGFQMPVVVLVLGWVGVVTPALLSRYRKHAIMVCAILGAALTPGDPVSMVFMTVPLIILFELGILLLKWFPASRVAGEEPEAAPMLDGEGGGP